MFFFFFWGGGVGGGTGDCTHETLFFQCRAWWMHIKTYSSIDFNFY